MSSALLAGAGQYKQALNAAKLHLRDRDLSIDTIRRLRTVVGRQPPHGSPRKISDQLKDDDGGDWQAMLRNIGHRDDFAIPNAQRTIEQHFPEVAQGAKLLGKGVESRVFKLNARPDAVLKLTRVNSPEHMKVLMGVPQGLTARMAEPKVIHTNPDGSGIIGVLEHAARPGSYYPGRPGFSAVRQATLLRKARYLGYTPHDINLIRNDQLGLLPNGDLRILDAGAIVPSNMPDPNRVVGVFGRPAMDKSLMSADPELYRKAVKVPVSRDDTEFAELDAAVANVLKNPRAHVLTNRLNIPVGGEAAMNPADQAMHQQFVRKGVVGENKQYFGPPKLLTRIGRGIREVAGAVGPAAVPLAIGAGALGIGAYMDHKDNERKRTVAKTPKPVVQLPAVEEKAKAASVQ